MKTICFKLISGEELIAQVDSEDSEYLTVCNPVTLSYEYDSYGDYGLKFMNFMPYGSELVFTFARKHIITYIDPSEKILKYYTKYLVSYSDSDTYQSNSPINSSQFH